MNAPSTVREALLLEAIGDVAQLLQRVEALGPSLNESRQALLRASEQFDRGLAAFKHQMAMITEAAKVQTVKHFAARVDESSRQTIELQSRAMADAARVAFGAELGATMQRLQTTLRPLLEERDRRWERWWAYAAVAAASSATTLVLVGYLWPR